MQNMMMLDNQAYALFEVPGPAFMLKSDVNATIENCKGETVTSAPIRESIRFNGKFYGYYNVTLKANNKDTQDEKIISTPPEVHPEGTNSDLADNSPR